MSKDTWSARAWHRRASKPVSVWMMVFILAGLSHIAIPNYRWVLIHLFTLGILTNSIVVWSQHLTEKFLQHRLADAARPAMLRRIWALNAGIVIALTGQILELPHLTMLGATVIAAMLTWHGIGLLGIWKLTPGKRFRFVAAAYAAACFFLPLGAFFGGWLTLDPGAPVLLIAHVACNVAGFVGVVAAASLTILFPALWRAKGVAPTARLSLQLLILGVLATVVGAFLHVPELGLIVYLAGWVLNWQYWLRLVDIGKLTYPAGSALMAVTWLVLSLTWWLAHSLATPALADAAPLTRLPMLPLVVGFGAQLLIGIMSYLLPTTMGGGPAATRAGLAVLNRAGLLRLMLLNGGLLLWVSSDNSWFNVAASLLCLGSLAVFPVLMVLAVKAQVKVLRKQAPGPDGIPVPAYWQLALGAGLLAALFVVFFVFL